MNLLDEFEKKYRWEWLDDDFRDVLFQNDNTSETKRLRIEDKGSGSDPK